MMSSEPRSTTNEQSSSSSSSSSSPLRRRRSSRTSVIFIALAVLLLTLSLAPFLATRQVQFEAHGLHPLTLDKRRRRQQQQQLQQWQQQEQVQEQQQQDQPSVLPASCKKMKSDPPIHDPNEGLDKDETKRLTITDPKFYISLHSQFFDKMRWVHIMKQGEYYEKGLTSLFHRILSAYDTTTSSSQQQSRPPLVLDIGMNIGWFTLYSRAHGHDVAAFEPNPVMFYRVCESLEYNGWLDEGGDGKENNDDFGGVTLWNYGLGASPGVFNLTLGKNPGGSSFHEDRLAPKFRKTMPVSVIQLDTIAMQEGWLDRKISLVKVDVEGFENFVFEGGKTLFYNGNVDNILMENSINNITTVGTMVDMLYDAGYRVKEIRTVNGDPYHEDWWHTFNPELERRYDHNNNNKANGEGGMVVPPAQEPPPESDQLRFLAKATCNVWWQHERIYKTERGDTT